MKKYTITFKKQQQQQHKSIALDIWKRSEQPNITVHVFISLFDFSKQSTSTPTSACYS